MTRAARSHALHAAESLKPIYVDPGNVALFTLENVAIMVWFAQPSAASVERLDRHLASLRAVRDPALTMVHVIKSPLRLPDEASRAAMLHVTKEHNVSLVVMVVSESGFMLSMMRSVITGLRVLTAGRFDYRVEASVDNVAAWLPKQHLAKTGVEIDSERLLHALHSADQLAP